MKNCLMVVLLLLAWAIPAMASESPTLSGIADAAKRSGDRSRQALVSIFGEVVNNPLAGTGGSDTILGALFQSTNSVLLVVGGLFACYIWVRNLTKIAYDGTVFTRDQHTLWGPVRTVWGLAALVPTANGWALSQLLMLWAASLLGVGSANLGTDAAIAAFNDGSGMIVQPAMPNTVTLARSVFEADLCMHAMNAGLSQALANGGFDFTDEYVQQFDLANGFMLKNPGQSKVCGGATVDPALLSVAAAPDKWIGATIDTSPIYQAHLSALGTMQSALSAAAIAFVNSAGSRMDGETATLPDAESAIQTAAINYEKTVNMKAGDKVGDIAALASKISDKIKDGGWWMLGAWYQTFAHANSKLSSAVSGKAQTYGEAFAGDQGISSLRDAIFKMYRTQQASSTDAVALGQTVSTTNTDTSKFLGSIFSSPGQKIAYYMTNMELGGSGGGTVNPLIKMKNLGDYTLVAAESASATYFGAKVVAGVADGGNLLARVVNLSTGLGDAIHSAVDAVTPFFFMIIIPMFLIGIGLSAYLPLVPFIIWFGAIINWMAVVLEAVFAAPLWALTHLAGEGDGLGSRSAHGYIFLLNVTMRPVLMVLGFFGGGACMVVGGTFLNEIYGIAVANVQFDSVTGLVMMLVFLYVYFSLSLTLIHSCFNLILLVPDQIIHWVGGVRSTELGRDSNDTIKSSVNLLVNRLENLRPGPSLKNTSPGNPGNGIRR